MAQKPIKMVLPVQQSKNGSTPKNTRVSRLHRPSPPPWYSVCVINHFYWFYITLLSFLLLSLALALSLSRFGIKSQRFPKKRNCAISVKCAKVAINMLRSDTSIRNAVKRRSFRVTVPLRQRIRYGFIGNLMRPLALTLIPANPARHGLGRPWSFGFLWLFWLWLVL